MRVESKSLKKKFVSKVNNCASYLTKKAAGILHGCDSVRRDTGGNPIGAAIAQTGSGAVGPRGRGCFIPVLTMLFA